MLKLPQAWYHNANKTRWNNRDMVKWAVDTMGHETNVLLDGAGGGSMTPGVFRFDIRSCAMKFIFEQVRFRLERELVSLQQPAKSMSMY